MMIETIHSPQDLEGMKNEELEQLAQEIRDFLIQKVSKTGGHLSSNLGVVELTIALYKAFHSPNDQIVWDVSHQTYVQKILTGRADRFGTLRKKDGLSGFTRTYESPYDLFNGGHASNSISLAYGLAKARDVRQTGGEVIAVIGDGALTGGMAYEALNSAGKGESKLIVVVNDNEMSIRHNVGHIAQNLNRIRTRKFYLRTKVDAKKMLLHMPGGGKGLYRHLRRLKRRLKYFLLNGVIFEELGFTYLGPVDGHSIKDLTKALEQARKLDEPVLVHVRTIKGKGYEPAERDPSLFHGVGAFDPVSGEVPYAGSLTWSDVFGKTMLKLAEEEPHLVGVSAAMVDGTGLADFARFYPERLFDVGIAEEHAVTFAAGLAKGGLRPVVAIYSTFLQRAYDQILHDVCMNDLPVVFAVDRAGIVGEDGESHQGVYDLAYLAHIPGLTVMAPADGAEMVHMLRAALSWERPCAIRYPKGCVGKPVSGGSTFGQASVPYGKAVVLKENDNAEVCIVALGACVPMALEAAETLSAEGIACCVINARFAAPIDLDTINTWAERCQLLLTVEDHVDEGGFGESVLAGIRPEFRDKVRRIAIPNGFIRQGSRQELLDEYGISVEGIVRTVRRAR